VINSQKRPLLEAICKVDKRAGYQLLNNSFSPVTRELKAGSIVDIKDSRRGAQIQDFNLVGLETHE